MHMGHLQGREAVIGMIRRALAATRGSFDLSVVETMESGGHLAAALIAWSA